MNENDLRVQRTRSLLRQALIELVSRQSYESISVRDIARHAQVGYKTFYRHYASKEALLQTLVDDLPDEFRQLLLAPDTDRSSHHSTIAALAYVETHAELIAMILNSSVGDRLLRAGEFVALEEGRQWFRSPHVPDDLMAHHFAASMMSFLRWWLESGMAYSKEEMATYIHQLLIDPLKQLRG